MMGWVPESWGSRAWGEGRGVLFGLRADLLARLCILDAGCMVHGVVSWVQGLEDREEVLVGGDEAYL